MERFVILEAASLSELNEKMNKHSDKYAPVGNLIFADGKFIQQIQLSERGEEILKMEEENGYVKVSSLDALLEVLPSGKRILMESDISEFPKTTLEYPVEIDLKGHTLSFASGASISIKSSLKLSNGTVLSAISGNGYPLKVKQGYLELNNMVINDENTISHGGIATTGDFKEEMNIVVKNSTVYGKQVAIASFGGNFKLYNSNFYTSPTGYYAICSNGNTSYPDCDMYAENCVLCSTGKESAGIYWPNKGNLILSNCSVTGDVAAYIKCGDVKLRGGNYKSTFATKAPYVFANGGFNLTGDTIVCDACNYPKKDANVSLVGISVERACEEAYDVAEYVREGHIPSQKLNMSSQLNLKVLYL